MKAVRLLAALFALALAACGDGSIKSPDFTAELESISIEPATGSVALGETVQFRAYGLYSAPPGQTGETREITSSVSWASNDTSVATINASGVATGAQVGTAGITASLGDHQASAQLNVGAAVIRNMVVRTLSGATQASVAVGQSVQIYAYGVYSDGSERLISSADNLVPWTSGNDTSVAVAPTEGPTTTASALQVSAVPVLVTAALKTLGGDPVLQRDGSTPITASFAVTVSSAAIVSLKQVQWESDAVPAAADPAPTTALKLTQGATLKAVAIAVYTDGTTGIVADDKLNWTKEPADSALADIDASGNVSGTAKGTLKIRATLKVAPVGGGSATAARDVIVADASCTNPARDDQFVARGWFVPVLCLICSANDAGNVIDADDSNYATLTNNVALLGGETAINVALKDDAAPALNTGPAPKEVSFLIAIDQGTFPVLNLGLFNILYISLHSDAGGDDSLTGRVAASNGSINALELTLLGLNLVPGYDTVKVSYVPPANVEYRRFRLGNNAGVAQVNLSGKAIRVSNACLPE